MSFPITFMILLQGWTVYGPTEKVPLTSDQVQYVYLMCVGSKIEERARSTTNEFDEIFTSAKTMCEENIKLVLETAADKSAAKLKILETDLLIKRVGQQAVAQIRERDRKFLEGLETGKNAKN